MFVCALDNQALAQTKINEKIRGAKLRDFLCAFVGDTR
jgi:hypothetical protein